MRVHRAAVTLHDGRRRERPPDDTGRRLDTRHAGRCLDTAGRRPDDRTRENLVGIVASAAASVPGHSLIRPSRHAERRYSHVSTRRWSALRANLRDRLLRRRRPSQSPTAGQERLSESRGRLAPVASSRSSETRQTERQRGDRIRTSSRRFRARSAVFGRRSPRQSRNSAVVASTSGQSASLRSMPRCSGQERDPAVRDVCTERRCTNSSRRSPGDACQGGESRR